MKTNGVVLGIFVVWILRILRGGREQSRDVLGSSFWVVVLEVETGLGKQRRVVGGRLSAAQARPFGEGELKRECQNVV